MVPILPIPRTGCEATLEPPVAFQGTVGFCRKFSWVALCSTISLHPLWSAHRETTMTVSFTGAHVPPEIIRMGVRWSGASPLRARHGEARLEERGVPLDHATLQRGGVQDSPLWAAALPRHPPPGWVSWRLDETSRQVQGPWRARRGADGPEHRLPPHRAARRAGGAALFEKLTIAGSAAHAAASRATMPSTTPRSPSVRANMCIIAWK